MLGNFANFVDYVTSYVLESYMFSLRILEEILFFDLDDMSHNGYLLKYKLYV